MVNVRNANAMAEVVYYLKGIRQEDINKIPKNLLQYLNDNASKEYECNFDYNKPLKELNLLDEARGIIGMICYNYWCVDEIQKKQYIDRLNTNELQYQEKLHEKYNPDNLFKNKNRKNIEENVTTTEMIEHKENIFK
ncbi:MAG: hypothetical protein IKF17_02400 [Clostridia bacterium]|nr:hypothetical protein [Clostridia bacterium]